MLSSVRRISLLRTRYDDFVVNTLCKRYARQVTVHSRNYVLGYVMTGSRNDSNRIRDSKCSFSTKDFSSSSDSTNPSESELSAVQFEKISDETLESLTEYFDELVEVAAHLPDADVSYGDGVLTVKFGDPYGTYVINRQTPNKQIWLSSPKSGPKRYDFLNGKWIYRHDGKSLHELLGDEIPKIVKAETRFDKCSFSGAERQTATNTL